MLMPSVESSGGRNYSMAGESEELDISINEIDE